MNFRLRGVRVRRVRRLGWSVVHVHLHLGLFWLRLLLLGRLDYNRLKNLLHGVMMNRRREQTGGGGGQNGSVS